MAWIYLVCCWGRVTHICFNPLFVSLFCCWSESCLGCLIYISCLFLAFYSLFVFHAISTQLDRYINVYKNCEYVVHFSNKKNLKKKKTLINVGCGTFNRFHSPVIVHRKHEGAVTRHEFLPSSARKHLHFKGGCRPQTPCLQVLYFWLRHCFQTGLHIYSPQPFY